MRGGLSSGRLAAFTAIIVLVALQAVAVNYLGRNNYLPEGSEHWTEDWLIHYFSKQLAEPHKVIALVLVDAESLEKAGLPTTLPVDRGWMGSLVSAISQQRPRAIGLDFYYYTPIDPKKDEQLASAIRDARAPVVIAAVDNAFLRTEAQQKFQQSFIQRVNRPAGHIYLKRSQELLSMGDKAARAIDHGPSDDGYGSFTSILAGLPSVTSMFGTHEIPEGTQRIDWLLAPPDGQTFQRIPAFEIFEAQEGTRPLLLKDKIVLVGPDFAGLDQHSVPFSLGRSQAVYPGVFVHAQALAQILDGRFFFSWTSEQQFLLLFAIGLAGAAVGWSFHDARLDFILGIAGTLLIVAASVPFFMMRIPLPTALAILSWGLSLWIAQRVRAFRAH
jgi:adenylate cyclase